MNRKILFRGKRIDNGQWVYGDLYHRKICGVVSPTIHNIEYTGGIVDPATVGQYTGVVDKNGKQVYEGDIIGYTDTGETSVFGVVRWCSEGNFGINDHRLEGYNDDEPFCNVGYMLKHSRKLSVIGNIHDTQTDLKGGEK